MTIDQGLIDMYGNYFLEKRKEFPGKVPSFKPYRFVFTDQWLESLTRLFLSMPKDYLSQHRTLMTDLVEKIREKKNYSFFLEALRTIEQKFNLPFPLYLYELKEARQTIPSFLMTEILLIWALMEKDGKLLVCVRDRYERKRFPLPDDAYSRRRAITAIGHHILSVLPFIEPKYLDLIPDKFGPLVEGEDPVIQLPTFYSTIAEVLNDASVRQRYIIDSEGTLVQWKKGAADLREMFIRVINGVVIAKVTTSAGGTLAFLDLATSGGLDLIIHKEGPENPLALDLAAAYHKLVTAKEIKVGRETKLEIPTVEMAAEKPEVAGEGPTVVYIPRTVVTRVGPTREERVSLRQMIRHESPRDHARHLKRGEMSLEQRRKIEEFQREKGADVLNWLRPGWTYVLPHDWRKRKRVVHLAARVEPQLSQLRAN